MILHKHQNIAEITPGMELFLRQMCEIICQGNIVIEAMQVHFLEWKNNFCKEKLEYITARNKGTLFPIQIN